MFLASCLGQTCTRPVKRHVLNDYGDLVVVIRPCGALVDPGQMFCDRCDLEIRAQRASEAEDETPREEVETS